VIVINRLTIIGNLTRDPQLRYTPQQTPVCDFTVAVNRRQKSDNGQQEADFFHVTAWKQLAENCSRFLSKGRKVAVCGPVSARTYQANDGSTRVSLDVTADDVEFLSPRNEQEMVQEQSYQRQERMAIQHEAGFTPVETSDLPW